MVELFLVELLKSIEIAINIEKKWGWIIFNIEDIGKYLKLYWNCISELLNYLTVLNFTTNRERITSKTRSTRTDRTMSIYSAQWIITTWSNAWIWTLFIVTCKIWWTLRVYGALRTTIRRFSYVTRNAWTCWIVSNTLTSRICTARWWNARIFYGLIIF